MLPFFFCNDLNLKKHTQLKEQGAQNAATAEQFNDLQQKYDALLQMYGEKVEEIQELHLDLDDVKEMYRGQLDELMLQLREAKKRQHDSSTSSPAK